MGYNISFYRIPDDFRNLTKTLTNQNRITQYTDVKFKEGRSLQEFDFTLKEDTVNTIQALTRVNYCAVYATSVTGYRNTYYYVDSIKVLPTGYITMHFREDVLMTHSAQIKDLTVTLDRSETIYNGYLPDSDYTALGYRSITCRAFDKGLTTNSFILMTTG